MPNYIDLIATDILHTAEGAEGWVEDLPLYRIYAVLALAKGPSVTNEDVHDAWAAWQTATHPQHGAIIPYDMLTPDVQALDTPYTLAIRAVAARHRGRGRE